MALVEGHAEHVMDAAGAPLVPSLTRLRAALDRRRTERTPLAALLERLLGLDMKLRQYTDGKRFCDEVVAREGIAALNRAWSRRSCCPAPPSSPTPAPGCAARARASCPPRPEPGRKPGIPLLRVTRSREEGTNTCTQNICSSCATLFVSSLEVIDRYPRFSHGHHAFQPQARRRSARPPPRPPRAAQVDGPQAGRRQDRSRSPSSRQTAAERAAAYAERAAHVQVGAVLTARDQVVDLVGDVASKVSSREAAEKELKKLEKRGASAQTRARREVKKTRTRVERELRQRRNRVEREVKRNRTRVEREVRSLRKDVEASAFDAPGVASTAS